MVMMLDAQRTPNLEHITRAFLRSGRLDSHEQAVNFQKSNVGMLYMQSQLFCLQMIIQWWCSQGLGDEALFLYEKLSHRDSIRHCWSWKQVLRDCFVSALKESAEPALLDSI